MEPIVLIGGGGHCVSCIDVIRLNGMYKIVGILDNKLRIGSAVMDCKVIGNDNDIPNLALSCHNFLITVGQIKTAAIRMKLYNIIKRYKGTLPVIISPRSYVSQTAEIDEGTIILHDAVINAKAKIGKACIINTGSLVEHEAVVGDFCHISTHSVVNGQVIIGNNSFLGSNSVIANNISLPEKIIISAGACIVKNPEKTGTYIGNPAKYLPNI